MFGISVSSVSYDPGTNAITFNDPEYDYCGVSTSLQITDSSFSRDYFDSANYSSCTPNGALTFVLTPGSDAFTSGSDIALRMTYSGNGDYYESQTLTVSNLEDFTPTPTPSSTPIPTSPPLPPRMCLVSQLVLYHMTPVLML